MATKKEAERWLPALTEANPSVNYGIVELIET